MAMGLGGLLDDAFRTASREHGAMADGRIHVDSLQRAAQVLDASAEYQVSEVADRNAGIVLKINKERLKD